MAWDGFDSVDFIMDVERTFGIRIPDREAERLMTAGQAYDYQGDQLCPGPDLRGRRWGS
jgi:acyl carrier protein